MANQITACHVLRLLTPGGDVVWLVPCRTEDVTSLSFEIVVEGHWALGA